MSTMIDASTRALVRIVVSDNYRRNSIVNVYQVVRLIPVGDSAPEIKALMDLIAEEAIRLSAPLSWDKHDTEMCGDDQANSDAINGSRASISA